MVQYVNSDGHRNYAAENVQKRQNDVLTQMFEDSGLPESYRAEFMANPYSGQESKEYIARLHSRYYEEGYNSESAKAERLRAAGINPDIQGLEGASESSAVDIPHSERSQERWQRFSALSDGLLNLAGLCLSVPDVIHSTKMKKLVSGNLETEIADKLARKYPSEKVDIAPKGSPLASVLVDRGVNSRDLVRSLFPDRSQSFVDRMAKRVDLSRSSISNRVSSAKDLLELRDTLNSPSLSAPDLGTNLVNIDAKLKLIKMKNALAAENELSEWREKTKEKREQNFVDNLDTTSDQLSASRAESAARSAEAGLRIDTANSTSGADIGEAKTEKAIFDKHYNQAVKEALDVLNSPEADDLLNTSLLSDFFNLPFSLNAREQYDYLTDRKRKRKQAKRAYQTVYHQKPSNGNFKISTNGLEYSE